MYLFFYLKNKIFLKIEKYIKYKNIFYIILFYEIIVLNLVYKYIVNIWVWIERWIFIKNRMKLDTLFYILFILFRVFYGYGF